MPNVYSHPHAPLTFSGLQWVSAPVHNTIGRGSLTLRCRRGGNMECKRCGAPMVLRHSQGYPCLFCEYCGASHFPKLSLQSVRPPEAVEVVTTKPGKLPCPLCHERLAEALIDDLPGWRCKKCRGILINQEIFWEIVKTRRAYGGGSPERPKPLVKWELKRKLSCPQCGKKMETHPYYGPGRFIVQTCRFCKLIWLDYGEFGKAIRAPGYDRRFW